MARTGMGMPGFGSAPLLSLWQATAMASALPQDEAVRGALDDLDGRASFVFGLLIVERLARVAEEIFPRSLPGSEVSYRRVRTALDDLWARLDNPTPAESLAGRVRRWGPVDETGQVSAGEGTSLAYLIGLNVCELAVAARSDQRVRESRSGYSVDGLKETALTNGVDTFLSALTFGLVGIPADIATNPGSYDIAAEGLSSAQEYFIKVFSGTIVDSSGLAADAVGDATRPTATCSN